VIHDHIYGSEVEAKKLNGLDCRSMAGRIESSLWRLEYISVGMILDETSFGQMGSFEILPLNANHQPSDDVKAILAFIGNELNVQVVRPEFVSFVIYSNPTTLKALTCSAENSSFPFSGFTCTCSPPRDWTVSVGQRLKRSTL
jgi:hypothetical protein